MFYKEKKIANWAILIYTISFYAYASNSMGIDQDLGINQLFFISTLYFYKKSNILSLGNILKIVVSNSLLTLSRPILGLIIFFIIFLDMFGNTIVKYGKEIKIKYILGMLLQYIKIFIPYLIIGGGLCYVLYYLLPDPIVKSINTYITLFNLDKSGITFLTRLSFVGQIFMYITPLVLCIFLLVKDWSKNQLIIISSFVMFLYGYMGSSGGDPARRMMPILPILMIGIGYICNQYINKKNIIWVIVIAIVMLSINSNINYQTLPLNVNDYISDPLNKIFILASTIIRPIYLSSKLVFFIGGFSLLSFLSILIFKKNIFKIIFLIFGLGINIFLISTDILNIGQPDIPTISKKMYNFCYQNCKVGENIYTDYISDTVLLAVLNREVGPYFSTSVDQNIKDKNQIILNHFYNFKSINLFSDKKPIEDYRRDQIKKNGSGYVFLTYYFGKRNDNILDILNKNCNLKEIFTGNNYVKGFAYYCNINSNILTN
ncbi:MAG: hypothetical protein WAZ75_00655 [Candidatus Absconditicoccaceae bacterium]